MLNWLNSVSVLVLVLVVIALCFSRRTLHRCYAVITVLVLVSVAFDAGLSPWWRAGTTAITGLKRATQDIWTAVTGSGKAPAAGNAPVPDGVPTAVLWVGPFVLVGAVLWVLDKLSTLSEPPQVSVAEPADTDTPEVRQLLTELRFRLPSVAVRRPAPVPGSSRGDKVAAVVEATEADAGKILGGLIRLWAVLTPSPRRYVARLYAERCCNSDASVLDGLKTDPLLWVTVDLRDQRTETSVAVATFEPTKLSDAAERAAAYVAAVVVRKDPSVPGWTKNGPDRADDLAAYQLCPPVPGYGHSYAEVRANRGERRRHLEPVVRNGRVSAVVRYELAVLDELDGRPLDALRLHARNRAEYPRFRDGRYRLAMSLTMAAGDSVARPTKDKDKDNPPPQRLLDDIAHWLDHIRRRRQPALPHPVDLRTRQAREAMLDLAEREFIAYRWSLALLPLSVLFRRSERAAVAPSGTAWRTWHARREAAHTALFLCRARRAQLRGEPMPTLTWARHGWDLYSWARGEADRLAARPAKRTFPWQHAYNLACLLALPLPSDATVLNERQRSDFRRVLGLLTLVTESPNSHGLVEWIGRDPDLAVLHEHGGFIDFVRERIARDYSPQATRLPADADWFVGQVHAATGAWTGQRHVRTRPGQPGHLPAGAQDLHRLGQHRQLPRRAERRAVQLLHQRLTPHAQIRASGAGDDSFQNGWYV